METIEYTKITTEISGREKITIEYPNADVDAEDMCQAFRTIMVGLTFTDETAGDMIATYLERYYGDRYNVVSIDG